MARQSENLAADTTNPLAGGVSQIYSGSATLGTGAHARKRLFSLGCVLTPTALCARW